MILTYEDYLNIAAEVEEGNGLIEYENGNELLSIEYSYEVDGYVEDDYYNGTGAFVETSRNFTINNAVVTTDEGNCYEISLDENLIENLIA